MKSSIITYIFHKISKNIDRLQQVENVATTMSFEKKMIFM